MFRKGKIDDERVSIDLTLSELINKYVGKNYINVEYKHNGSVSVWISSSVITEHSDCNGGDQDEREAIKASD